MVKDSLVDQAFSLLGENAVKSTLLDLIISKLSHEDTERHTINLLNKKLSNYRTRVEGFDILTRCLPHCSSSIILENSSNWLNHCTNRHEQDKFREVYLNSIAVIIECSHSIPDFNKKFVSEHLSSVVDLCINSRSYDNAICASLNCVIECLQHYSSSCGPYKKKFESYLLENLDRSSEKLVELTGYALHFLQQTGNAGNDGINHKNNVTLFIKKLCATVHKLYDFLFESEAEFETITNIDQNPLDLPPVPVFFNVYKTTQLIHQRLKNCLIILKVLLSKQCTKIIYPSEVLGVIRRGMSLHSCLEKENISMEIAHYSIVLYKIQTELLEFLQVFFVGMGVALMPYYHMISKILMDALSRLYGCSCYRLNSLYQERIYNVLRRWLELVRSGFHVLYHDDLIAYILKDISPITTVVVLSIQMNYSSKKSAKANKKAIQDRIIASGELSNKMQTRSPANEVKVLACQSALKVLNMLLNVTNIEAKQETLTSLYNTIITAVLALQSGQEFQPYINEECQLLLYETLAHIYQQDSVPILPPIQLVSRLLSFGSKHENRRISATCNNGLTILEKIAHPVCTSMYVHAEPNNSYMSSSNSFEDTDTSYFQSDTAELLGDISVEEGKESSDVSTLIEDIPESARSRGINILQQLIIVPGHDTSGTSIEQFEAEAINLPMNQNTHIEQLPPVDKEANNMNVDDNETRQQSELLENSDATIDSFNQTLISNDIILTRIKSDMSVISETSYSNIKHLCEDSIEIKDEEEEEPTPKRVKVELEDLVNSFVDEVNEY